ncbi:Threonylcarbamoyladenosine tRNA methylthiotransferase MtaB [bacterium HR29]|jgi:threonylcarbamoyladenosine tRNA methylthiotransferase MtaB|nr:Threonylcarbamoyladenosine tRNA methylthiotransferase MtaB [bacterium HR29]
MSRPVAAVLTLGCKLNLADSEEIARALRRAGYEVVDRLCEAEAVVINTCSVTHVADQKSRRLIRAARRLAPGAAVAVTGCYPQTAGFDAVRALGADIVAGTRDADKAELVAALSARAGRSTPQETSPEAGLRIRAFIKAQEGCNDVCAFCIVPRTRHREESRSIERVVAEVEAAGAAGAKEVVLTGTQLGAWGRDLVPPLRPHHLIAGVLERTEVPRLRFSSLQPQDITPELLALWSDPRLMPHFHLALQSGSDRILAAMRRRYTIREYLAAVARIRAAVPDAAITTDVIAGFPGETEEDFRATLRVCEEVGFARIHVFPFSPRRGTLAAKLPEQVPPEVKRERAAALAELGRKLRERFAAANRGRRRPVLWEEERPTPDGLRWHGYTDNYIPVYASGEGLRNRIVPAVIGEPYLDGARAVVAGGAA